MSEIAVTKDFVNSGRALRGTDKGRVLDFIGKILDDPRTPGLNLERLEHRNRNVWSARITQDLRAILYQEGDLFYLLHAAHHDAAYDWAARRTFEKQPHTGQLLFVRTAEIVREKVVEREVVRDDPPLFAGHADEYLISLGAPVNWIPLLREIRSQNRLYEIAAELPEEVQERLFELASGGLPTPPPATPDRPTIESPDASRRFVVLEDVEEILPLLEAPMRDWMAFLHPSQKKLAGGTYGGPVKVTGSAGTGKTVVAMHRARHLARQGQRVLVTTYVGTLVANIEKHLDVLCKPDERARITVSTVHALAGRLLAQAKRSMRTVEDQELERRLAEEARRAGLPHEGPFLLSEWRSVLQNHEVATWDAYRSVSRAGRGVALGVTDRKKLWAVFEPVLRGLERERRCDWSGLCIEARHALERGEVTSPFDAVIVDEVQDLKAPELRMLATLAKAHPENLMLIGDAGQRIYPGGFSLRALDIDVRGRSHVLRVNYRTTEQIRRAADLVLGLEADDLDDGRENRRTRSILHGPQPEAVGFEDVRELAAWVAGRARDLLDQGLAPDEIACFARESRRFERVERELEAQGLPTLRIAKDAPERRDAVHFGTLHRAKGLEYKVVFVLDASKRAIPLPAVQKKVANDPQELKEFQARERSLLYVGMTRARDRLFVTWVKEPSPFLEPWLQHAESHP